LALRNRIVFLLFVLLMLPGASASDPGSAPASAALTASVSDTPDAVRLRIQASGDVEPGSVEVRVAGRKAVVLARDAEGRAIRSQSVRLPAPVVEQEASAAYDADGALLITLPKQITAQDARPTGDAKAAAP
jgi:HSP20 family molecular chaperone IbpA